MRLNRVKFLRFLMASALICPTFSDFVLSVKAMGEEDSNSLISDSIISEMEDVNNILQNAVGDEANSSVIDELVSEDVVEENLEELVEEVQTDDVVEQNKELVEPDESEITVVNDEVQSRSSKSGLVQLYQVVPDGQQSKEGKTTKEIMSALQCKPNHDLYPLNNTSQHTTYVNSCYVDDAMYLGEDNDYFYIYLSGYEGKVAKSKSHYYELDLNGDGQKVTYEIQTVAYFIPEATTYSLEPSEARILSETPELLFNTDYLNKGDVDSEISLARTSKVVLGPSYYANESGDLVHYITNDVTASNNYSKIIVGKAPSWMNSNVKYYSYDGIYFYNHWNQIKVNGSGAVNQNNPFYNYYQYLPYRSKSVYTASAFDSFTNSYGYSKVPTGSTAASNESQLVNAGSIFYSVQDKFGVNGALEYAMAIHESGWGRSAISVQKNNLFGMNATDNNPYGNATSFPSVENGIFYHSDYYISRGYTDPNDWRYFGSHVGNKGSGMNVKYASDPFWGEKIAGWYYKFDTANGLKDYNNYSIGINNNGAVYNIRQLANTNSSILYKTTNSSSKVYNYPFLIVGSEGNFYKIKTDTPINENGVTQYSAIYEWDRTYAYVSKDAVNYLNHTNYVDPNLKNEIVNRLSTFKMNGTQIEYDGYAYMSGVDIPNQSNIQQKILVKDSNAKSVASITLDSYYSTSVSTAAAHGNNKYNYDWAKVKGTFSLPALSDGEYTLIMRVNAKGITDEVPLILHSSIGYFNYKNNNKLYEFYPTTSGVTLKVSTLSPKDNPHINRLSYIRNENGMLYLDGYSYIQHVNIPSQTDIIQKIKFVNTSTLQQVLTFDLPTFYSTAATKDPNHGNNVYNYDWAKYRGSIDISSLPIGEYYIKIYTNSKGYQFDTIATIHSGVQDFNIKTNGKTISFNRVTYEGISTFKVAVTNN